MDLENQLSKYLNTKVYLNYIKNNLILYCLNKRLKKKIILYIDKKFEWYEKPKTIKFLKKFPLSKSSGKIDKNKLF